MAFTYFFRDLQTLELITEHLVPFVSGKQRVRIWDAGCATGQEPYTLAILLAERMNKYAFNNVSIHATDIDANFEKIVTDGVYAWSDLQRIPTPLFEKYFAGVPGETDRFQISGHLRARIQFAHADLLELRAPAGELSLVLCKNVLLHFPYEKRLEVLRVYHAALSDGGFLAMEHTQKLPEEVAHLFEPATPTAQLYRKRAR
jgi:chemotaxis protein methyltransferase CheR